MEYGTFKNSQINSRIPDQKVVLSKNLIVRKDNEGKKVLINRLSSIAVHLNSSLISFLNRFSRNGIMLSKLLSEYSDADLSSTISHLLDINFLIPENINEDFLWLKAHVTMDYITKFETKHFIIFHHGNNSYLARNFSDFMERVFNFLIQNLKFVSLQKIVILICKNQVDFQKFWGDTPAPDWADAFVYSSNLIIISHRRANNTSLNGDGPFQGMAHELAHIFLGQMTCRLPIWLEEGLCEYFSKAEHAPVSFENCMQTKIYGFQEIELFGNPSLLELDKSPVGANICYRQSHSFVAFLMNLQSRQSFVNLLCSMDLADSFNISFEKYYNLSIKDVQKEWCKQYPHIKTVKLKTSKNLKSIEGSKNILLYNSISGDSLKADSDILTLLECFKNTTTLNELTAKFDIENFDSIITRLFRKQLIVFDHDREENLIYQNFNLKDVQKGFLINQLRLNLSNSCNMACNYCYIDPEKKEHMSWQTAKKALTLFFDLQKESGKKDAPIRFFGGEPLLNWHVMKQTFKYVDTIKNGIKVDYILNTNGTIVSEDITKTLSLNKVFLSISVDGLQKIHDKFRPLKSGRGSFSTIDTNLNLFITSGCDIALSATIGDHNYNKLKDLIEYIADKNSRYNCSISLSLQSMCMESKQGLDTVSVEKKIKAVKNAVLYAVKQNVNVSYGMLMFPLNALLGLKPKGIYCNATAGEEICIDPDGDIYPCGTLKTELGNIQNFKAAFQTTSYLNLVKRVTGNIPQCKSCDIEAFCAGGCAADAMLNGNIFLPAKNCKFEQLFFKAMVREYLNGTYA